MGLVAAGLEHVVDVKVPQEIALTFAGSTLQIEQRNLAMNEFVAKLIEQLRAKDVYALLAKGQGIAQCYERPLWRASGDVDLVISEESYEKAKKVLLPLAIDVKQEFKTLKHQGMSMKGGFEVELHGTLHSRLSRRLDNGLDQILNEIFVEGKVRSWDNGGTIVYLPEPDSDVLFLFAHILQHYYVEGIGLRQICDWCRFLYCYKKDLDVQMLENRLKAMGLISEWKAFAAVAINWLGMPVESMPFYSNDKKWSRKAERIIAFVLERGNFGHNREVKWSSNYLVGKLRSFGRKMVDFGRHVGVFPVDSVQFFFHFSWDGVRNL